MQRGLFTRAQARGVQPAEVPAAPFWGMSNATEGDVAATVDPVDLNCVLNALSLSKPPRDESMTAAKKAAEFRLAVARLEGNGAAETVVIAEALAVAARSPVAAPVKTEKEKNDAVAAAAALALKRAVHSSASLEDFLIDAIGDDDSESDDQANHVVQEITAVSHERSRERREPRGQPAQRGRGAGQSGQRAGALPRRPAALAGVEAALHFHAPVDEWILSGRKTMETRRYALRREWAGRKVAIIQCGMDPKGGQQHGRKAKKLKPSIVGVVTFKRSFQYSDEVRLFALPLHFVRILLTI